MIRFVQKGNFKRTNGWLEKLLNVFNSGLLDKYGEMGVAALSSATPVKTGKTASSWGYEIEHASDGARINWINTNVNKGVNIALILQYGHGTGGHGYVVGIDYINPALRPVFEKIAKDAWEEVTKV